MSIRTHVFKFGGSSVGTPERIREVVRLVASEPQDARRIVVVSAFGGVTDRLLDAVREALSRSGAHRALLAELRGRHQAAIDALALPEEAAGLAAHVDGVWLELSELLDGVSLLRECTGRTRDALIGLGERVSAPIVAAAFRAAGVPAESVDARSIIRTDDAFGEANVDFDVTRGLALAWQQESDATKVSVVTGFIAATESGVQTTLGRSGSDFTATILAGVLDAERVVIWTDVDGVLSADPRLVPGAFTLPQLSYREAGEMAYFGAKVLHPRTMRPLQEAGIPLYIRNTMNPAAAGTLIHTDSGAIDGQVKAVTAIRDIALVMLEGAGMVGIPGISGRAFSALAANDINILLISQASSEQSICIGVRQEEAVRAEGALHASFELEVMRRDVSRIYSVPDCAVVSVVGDQMRMHPGIAGRMFSTLGYANINVLAIAQGASETNISAVVDGTDAQRAIRALHESFARSYERAHIFMIGAGVVGRELLSLLQRQVPRLSQSRHLNLRLVGVANSTRAFMDADGIEPQVAMDRLQTDGHAMDLDKVVEALRASHLERLILVDATASDAVAERYAELLESGIGVVTPNKRANTGALSYYDALQRTASKRAVPFLYETTVGAALPVISTLRDLVRSGDTVHRIEGVLSGTLAFVFGRLAAGDPFSVAVRTARERGFTEPDPRDDLGGEDVARKILTLAREAGWRFDRADVQVESLVPNHLANLDTAAFLDRLPELDADWAAREGRLQYVAEATPDKASVSIRVVPDDSVFARLRGTDNLVVFTTDRYADNPLIVQGAGAGPVVTAGGVLADVVRAAESMR